MILHSFLGVGKGWQLPKCPLMGSWLSKPGTSSHGWDPGSITRTERDLCAGMEGGQDSLLGDK